MKIELDAELTKIINYIGIKWEGLPKNEMNDIITTIFNESVNLCKFRYKQFDFLEINKKIAVNRVQLERWSSVESYERFDKAAGCDYIKNLSMYLLINTSAISKLLNEKVELDNNKNSFDDNIKAIKSKISKEINTSNLKPVGYSSFIKDFTDFKGQEYYAINLFDKDLTLFNNGNDLAIERISGEFVTSTALPYVVHDKVNNGRSPYNSLVGAIYGYMYKIMENNNTLEMQEDFERISKECKDSIYYNDIQNHIDFNHLITSDITRLIIDYSDIQYKPLSKEENEVKIKESIKKVDDYNVLSLAEKQIVMNKRRANLLNHNRMLGKDYDLEDSENAEIIKNILIGYNTKKTLKFK